MRIGQTASQRPQKVEAFGKLAGLVDADELRGQNGTHRAGIDPAIGVSANRMINRAMVHAGTAANAAQHVLKFGANHARSAIVEQDNMKLFRTVWILLAAGAGGKRRIN